MRNVVPAVVRILTPIPRLAILLLLTIFYCLTAPAVGAVHYYNSHGFSYSQRFTTKPLLDQLNFFGTRHPVFYQPAVIETYIMLSHKQFNIDYEDTVMYA
jgi:hypothetical protein